MASWVRVEALCHGWTCCRMITLTFPSYLPPFSMRGLTEALRLLVILRLLDVVSVIRRMQTAEGGYLKGQT